jgi:outer membrane protein OmpA-like peptidoglycan-associated protein
MKKQVLSFTEFINEAYSMINEGKTWSDVKTLLSDYLNQEAQDILANIESCLASDARSKTDFSGKTNILDSAGAMFAKVVSERLDSKYTNITEISTTISDLTYNKVIQGSVYATKSNPIGSSLGTNYGTFPVEDGKIKLQDALNAINIANMKKLYVYDTTDQTKRGSEFSQALKSDLQKGPWWLFGWKPGEKRKIYQSGSQDQVYITQIEDKLEVGKWSNNDKVTPASGVAPVDMSIDRGRKDKKRVFGTKKDSLTKAGQAYFTYVFYAVDPKSINAGKNKGADMTVNDIKMVKIPVKTPDVTEKLNIQDNGVLFTVNTSTLLEDGKKHIYNAITQNFTSVSEITVQGSASQEGDKANNEKLCKDRASAVVAYLKTVIDGGTITASDTANIQPATPATDEATRKTWRNVILTIKGTKINPGISKEEIKYVPITKKVKCDLVTIKEIQMTFNVEIDQDFAKKAGFLIRGVDTKGSTEYSGRSAGTRS